MATKTTELTVVMMKLWMTCSSKSFMAGRLGITTLVSRKMMPKYANDVHSGMGQ